MNSNNKSFSFFSLVLKCFKVAAIKLAFIYPTLKAKLLLQLQHCKYGKGLKICGKVYFRPDGNNSIILGDNVTILARLLTNSVGIESPSIFECRDGGVIEIGNRSGFTSVVMSSRLKITIGDDVKIGANVRIYDNDFHSLNYLKRRNNKSDFKNVKMARVIIEDDVFIGTGAIILKGVHIGARSIVGAGSVVAIKDIPADSLVFGNPAKIIQTKN